MREKETVKLLHLGCDVMNLYGEYANLLSLKRFLEKVSGKKCEITAVDEAAEASDIQDYDLIYMGSGTEKAQKRALADLLSVKENLTAAAEGGSVILFTGNAWELLGNSIKDAEGKTYGCLSFFDFETEETRKRITGDVVCENIFKASFQEENLCRLLGDNPTIGFINKCSVIEKKDWEISCFKMRLGTGDGNAKGEKAVEGGYMGNIFGTHLIGPLLIKNPHLLKFFAWKIFKNRGEEDLAEKALAADTPMESSAYLISLNELEKRINQET